MVCRTCATESVQGDLYCSHCGAELKNKSWRKVGTIVLCVGATIAVFMVIAALLIVVGAPAATNLAAQLVLEDINQSFADGALSEKSTYLHGQTFFANEDSVLSAGHDFTVAHDLDVVPNAEQLRPIEGAALEEAWQEAHTESEVLEVIEGEFASRYIYYFGTDDVGRHICDASPQRYIFNGDNTFVFFYSYRGGEIFQQGIFSAEQIEFEQLEVLAGSIGWRSMQFGRVEERADANWFMIDLAAYSDVGARTTEMFVSVLDDEIIMYLPHYGTTAKVDRIGQ